MMEALRWIVTVVVSVAISFGFSRVVRLIVGTYFNTLVAPYDLLLEVLTFFSALLCSLGIGIALQGRRERSQLLSQSIEEFKEQVTQSIETVIDNSLVTKLHGDLQSGIRTSRVFDDFNQLVLHLNTRSTGLIAAAGVFLEREFASLSGRLNELFSDGTLIDIADHVRMTRRLCANAETYLQIQRRAFRVPDEWTNEWCEFLEYLGHNKKIRKKYVVVLNQNEMTSSIERLNSMDRYLSQERVEFYVCDLERVRDALGGVLPTNRVIELFDKSVIKAADLPTGRYRGGNMLGMSVYDAAKRPDLMKYIEAVEAGSKSVREIRTQPGP